MIQNENKVVMLNTTFNNMPVSQESESVSNGCNYRSELPEYNRAP